MNQAAAVILCLAYIMGLLSTKVPYGQYVVLGLGIVLGLVMPGFRRAVVGRSAIANRAKASAKGRTRRETAALSKERLERGRRTPNLILLSKWLWFAAGFIGFLASLYFHSRIPEPTSNDISVLIQEDGSAQTQILTVSGKVLSMPRKTRAERSQFWLKVTQISELIGNDGAANVYKEATGKLYVTVPLLQANGIHPNQWASVTGSLYKPQPPSNPGSFDFPAYLAKQGSFAAFKGRQVKTKTLENSKTLGLWKIRRRIIRSHIAGLGVPEGTLVSAMVMGRRAVDLSYELRDRFIQVGLAHVLAASGFHVSLILGVLLFFAKGLSGGARFGLGTLTLIIYVSLTGFSPSILRAAFMGFAALIAIVSERQVKPLGALLVAAAILLLVNPLWIWDLGFQLSFLATLGLLVTVAPLMKILDWLPTPIASLVAVPIAASLWTFPLLLYVSNVVSPYSILVNVITAPLIAIVTLGGFVSAMVALVAPPAGSAIAGALYYPVQGSIATVEFFSKLPGNQVAVGAISHFQVIALYGIILFVWVFAYLRKPTQKQKQRKKKKQFPLLPVAIALSLIIVIAPVWSAKVSLFQATVLDTAGESVLVIQDEGRVTLLGSGDENAARFVILPFLRHTGVNQIDWAIAADSQEGLSNGWQTILESLTIKTFYDTSTETQSYPTSDRSILAAIEQSRAMYQTWSNNQVLELGSTRVKLLDAEAPVLQFEIGGKNWLLMGEIEASEQTRLLSEGNVSKTEVLWWQGNRLNVEFLNAIRPSVAIASSNSIDPKTAQCLKEKNIQIFWTGRDGAIQWTSSNGFETTLEADKIDSSVL
ncbi:MAG: ComEC/Rec2 family competence protein [Cyanobacteriota bacterium]|nr:ComEC/Rec2 family competence protein [Cyanobacteriota bacterium]